MYKCLYGLLMLLPQSSAFAALKNRLNSVSSIGYLHIAPRTYVTLLTRAQSLLSVTKSTESFFFSSNQSQTGGSNYDRPNRLKTRDEAIIRWADLLEKFRSVQDKARRMQAHAGHIGDDGPPMGVGDIRLGEGLEIKAPKDVRALAGPPMPSLKEPAAAAPPTAAPAVKQRSGLGRQLGRFGGAVSGRGKK